MSLLERAAERWKERYKEAWLKQLLMRRSRSRLITLENLAEMKEVILAKLQEDWPLIYELTFGGGVISLSARAKTLNFQ